MARLEMVVDNLQLSLENYKHVLILREKQGKRSLPIFVSYWEAEAIAAKLQNIPPLRPTTYDLLRNILNTIGFAVKSATLDRIENGIYYAELALGSHDKSHWLDCRPSDAVLIAISVGAPIFADEKVLDKAGMILDPETGKPV